VEFSYLLFQSLSIVVLEILPFWKLILISIQLSLLYLRTVSDATKTEARNATIVPHNSRQNLQRYQNSAKTITEHID
jgi:hypothetical protein